MMWTVAKPSISAKDSFETCANTVRAATLRARLLSVSDTIEKASAMYDSLASSQTLHVMPRPLDVLGTVTLDEMKSLYTNNMVHTLEGRKIYNAIKIAAERCPLCGIDRVETLDHMLAKSTHCELTVSPLNLVPACTACNTSSKPYFPTCIRTIFASLFRQCRRVQMVVCRGATSSTASL